MLVLINGDFKALRQGQFVSVSEDSKECGDFILDTDNCDYSCATLLEIASANKFSLKKERKEDMVSKLETGLQLLNLPEMNKMSDTDKVLEIVTEGFKAELPDDQMLVQIINSGVPYRLAGKMFRVCVENNGFRISGKKRAEAIDKILEDNEFFPETFAEVEAMCERIAVGVSAVEAKDGNEAVEAIEAVSDTTTQQAMKAIKKFLKVKEIEFPKAPKKAKGGLRLRFLTFAATHPAATDEELADWFASNTKDKSEEDVAKWMKRYSAVINHGRAMAKFCLDNDVAPAAESFYGETEEAETETED